MSGGGATITVWPLPVRIVHWSVALLVRAEFLIESGPLHRNAGYLAAALVVMRIGWGFVTRSVARNQSWFPTPARLRGYLQAMRAGGAPRALGLNPVGACMALALWTLVLALGVTGWMMGLDRFWGEEWLEQLHETIAWGLLGCAGLHLAAVIGTSIRQRENLPKAMVTGRKRPLAPEGPEGATK